MQQQSTALQRRWRAGAGACKIEDFPTQHTDYIIPWFTALPSEFGDGFDTIIRRSENLHNQKLEEIKLFVKEQKINIAKECEKIGKPVDMDPSHDPVSKPPIRLATLRMDNHPSFHKSDFVLRLRESGVKQEFMSPHTHYQGGKHESLNDPLNRHCLSQLVYAHAPHLFWSYAWAQAAHIHNLKKRAGSNF